MTFSQRSVFIRFLPDSAPDKATPSLPSILAPRSAEIVSGIRPFLRPSSHRSNATRRSDFCARPAPPAFPTLHRDRVILAISFQLPMQLHPGLLSSRRRHVSVTGVYGHSQP